MSALQKAFSTGSNEWNHPWLATATSVVFAVVGFTTGYLVLPHAVHVHSELVRGLALAASGGLGAVAGSVLFALLD